MKILKLLGFNLSTDKGRAEFYLSCLLFLITYSYIYVYQNILGIKLFYLWDVKTFADIPVVYLISLVFIRYFLIKPDPLQRGVSDKGEIKYFQSQFPSTYLKERCEMCIESENSCKNYIGNSSIQVREWFKLFNGPIKDNNLFVYNETLEKGYQCRMIYYGSWIFFVSLIFSSLMVGIAFILSKTMNHVLNLSLLQIMFPVMALFVLIMLKRLNRICDGKTTGCWRAWKEVNAEHLRWLEQHEPILVDNICRAGENLKVFRRMS